MGSVCLFAIVVLNSQNPSNSSPVWHNAEIGNLRLPIHSFCLCGPDSAVPLLHMDVVNSLSFTIAFSVQTLLYECSLLDLDSELFFHLSSQSVFKGLPRVHVTAGDLYQSGIRIVIISPPLHQELPSLQQNSIHAIGDCSSMSSASVHILVFPFRR